MIYLGDDISSQALDQGELIFAWRLSDLYKLTCALEVRILNGTTFILPFRLIVMECRPKLGKFVLSMRQKLLLRRERHLSIQLVPRTIHQESLIIARRL